MPRPIRKKQGSTFFWGDWMNDRELASCSLAARGLWIDMLCVMFFQTTKGVLENGMDTYLEYRYPDARMANLIRDELIPLLNELLDKGVCSTGKDMPGILPVDSIVSRKMYRKWLECSNYSEFGKIGAKVRWEKAKKAKIQENQDKWPHHSQTWPNDSQTPIAKEWPSDNTQTFDDNQLAENPEWPDDSQNLIAKRCISPALSPSITNQPTRINSLLADSLSVVQDSTESSSSQNQSGRLVGVNEAVYTIRLIALTNDNIFGTSQYRDMVKAILGNYKTRSAMNAFLEVANKKNYPSSYLQDKIKALYSKVES